MEANQCEPLWPLGQVLAYVGGPHRATLDRWIAKGLFPPPLSRPQGATVPRKRFWKSADVKAWLDARVVAGRDKRIVREIA